MGAVRIVVKYGEKHVLLTSQPTLQEMTDSVKRAFGLSTSPIKLFLAAPNMPRMELVQDSLSALRDNDMIEVDTTPQPNTKTKTFKVAIRLNAKCKSYAASPEKDPIRERICKLLTLGQNKGATEEEARKSMDTAARLMRKHRLETSECMQEHRPGATLLEQGGLYLVTVPDQLCQKWLRELAEVCADLFECKYCYSSGDGRSGCLFEFYGIDLNADLAAFAFETAYNQMEVLTSMYVPDQSKRDVELTIRADSVAKEVEAKQFSGGFKDYRESTANKTPTGGFEDGIKDAKKVNLKRPIGQITGA